MNKPLAENNVINGLRLAAKIVVQRYQDLPADERAAFKDSVSVPFDSINAEIISRKGTPVDWPVEETA